MVIAATAGSMFLIVLLRYLGFAGGAYWLCWVRNRKSWAHKRIDPAYPDRRIVQREVLWSVSTSLIFALSGVFLLHAWESGWTRIYTSIDEYGVAWFLASLPVMALVHETYFYWTHRWMHLPRVFRLMHRVHHDSRNPSPWAAFSFHPLEAIVEAIIIPAMLFVIPVHPAALIIFLMFMTVLGVVNHLGYELYPASFARHPFFRWWISATHHQLHHKKVHCNYGLYFTFWDRWLGTHHPEYESFYDEVKSRTPSVGT